MMKNHWEATHQDEMNAAAHDARAAVAAERDRYKKALEHCAEMQSKYVLEGGSPYERLAEVAAIAKQALRPTQSSVSGGEK